MSSHGPARSKLAVDKISRDFPINLWQQGHKYQSIFTKISDWKMFYLDVGRPIYDKVMWCTKHFWFINIPTDLHHENSAYFILYTLFFIFLRPVHKSLSEDFPLLSILFFFFLPNMLNSSTAGNDKAFLTVKIAYCFRVWLIFWGKTSYRLPAPWPLQNALTHSVQMGIFKYKNSLFAGQLLSRCQQSVWGLWNERPSSVEATVECCCISPDPLI